jgi:hypothetical protein
MDGEGERTERGASRLTPRMDGEGERTERGASRLTPGDGVRCWTAGLRRWIAIPGAVGGGAWRTARTGDAVGSESVRLDERLQPSITDSVCRIKVVDILGINRSPKQNFPTSAFSLYHIFTKHNKLYFM